MGYFKTQSILLHFCSHLFYLFDKAGFQTSSLEAQVTHQPLTLSCQCFLESALRDTKYYYRKYPPHISANDQFIYNLYLSPVISRNASMRFRIGLFVFLCALKMASNEAPPFDFTSCLILVTGNNNKEDFSSAPSHLGG